MDTTKYIDRLSQLITEDIDIINELNLGGRQVKLTDHSTNPLANKQSRNHPPVSTKQIDPYRDAKTVKGVLSHIYTDSKTLEGAKTAAGKVYLAAPAGFTAGTGQLDTMKAKAITVNDQGIIGRLADSNSASAKTIGKLIGQLYLAGQKLKWGKAALIVGDDNPKPFMQWIQHLAKIGAIDYGLVNIVRLNAKARKDSSFTNDPAAEWGKQPEKYRDISKSLTAAQKEFGSRIPEATEIFELMKVKGVGDKSPFIAKYITPSRKILGDVGRFITAASSRRREHSASDKKTLIVNITNVIGIVTKLKNAAETIVVRSGSVNEELRPVADEPWADPENKKYGHAEVNDLLATFNKIGLNGEYLNIIKQIELAVNAYKKNAMSRSEVAGKILTSTKIILSQLQELLSSLNKLTQAGVTLGKPKLKPLSGTTSAYVEAAEKRLPLEKFKSWLKTGMSISEIMTIFNIGNKLAKIVVDKYKTQLQA